MGKKIVPIAVVIAFILGIVVGPAIPLGTYIPSVNQIQDITQTQDCNLDIFESYPFALLKAKDLGYGDYAIMNPITTQILPPGTNMENLGLITKIKTYGVVLSNPEDTSLGLMVFVDECGEIFHHMVLPPEVMKTITESLQPLPPPKLTE